MVASVEQNKGPLNAWSFLAVTVDFGIDRPIFVVVVVVALRRGLIL